MGRYYWNKKGEVEDCHSISVQFLKKHGYLKPHQWMRGNIRWSFGGEPTGNVGFIVSTEEKYIEFDYKTRSYGEDEWQDRNYRVLLTTTVCHLGGVRYWFLCNGCNKRVGNLYINGDSDFACRECLNLTYRSRNTSSRFRAFEQLFKYDELEEKIYELRVKYYKGAPTKRHSRLLRRTNLYRRSMAVWAGLEEQLFAK